MFIKICGITNEEDALFAVAMGADAVGFIFAPSPRQVSPRKVYDITRRLPPEILTIGVFRNEHPTLVIKHALDSGVKGIQLSGRESPEQTAELAKSFRHVIKAFPSDSERLDRADQYGTDLIMLDGPSPGSGKVFDWNIAGRIPRGVRLILAGGLNPENVGDAIRAVEPWGVDVATGVESRPGKKDPTLVRQFVKNARAAAPERGGEYRGIDVLPYDWADE